LNEKRQKPLYSKGVNSGDFIIKKVIGRGTFGKVYMVRRKETENIYAMKVLKKYDLSQREQEEHTMTERQVLESSKHPFIVKLFYAFQTPERLYFILEFVQGGELFMRLKTQKKLPEDHAQFYAAEIILALQCLHSQNIYYRDLKPTNILIDSEGHIKLTDFGLAKKSKRKSYTF